MASRNRRSAYAALALVLGGAACDAPGSAPTSSPGSDAGALPGPSAAASAPSPSASVSARLASTGEERAGRWTAVCQAARAAVGVPKGLPDQTWRDDDGKTAAGEARIEVTIAADGTARGRLTGALGELVLSGMMDGSTLRAGMSPTDPTVAPAMSGLLLATAEGAVLVGELRVSSHDGALVRTAEVRLARESRPSP